MYQPLCLHLKSLMLKVLWYADGCFSENLQFLMCKFLMSYHHVLGCG